MSSELSAARQYRRVMGSGRHSFVVSVKDSDLWVAFSREEGEADQIHARAQKYLEDLRREMDLFCEYDPDFKNTLEPYMTDFSAPVPAQHMSRMSYVSEVGPMAGVAGAFAWYLGRELTRAFDLKEIIVENGGDLFISSPGELTVKLDAGGNGVTDKFALKIPADFGEFGLSSSSGSFGPSLSLGKADLAAVACRDAILADQLATAYANRIRSKEDVNKMIRDAERYPQILSMVIIKDDVIGVRGELPLTSL